MHLTQTSIIFPGVRSTQFMKKFQIWCRLVNICVFGRHLCNRFWVILQVSREIGGSFQINEYPFLDKINVNTKKSLHKKVIRFSWEYALSIVIVFRRIKSFCLRRLTAFNIQRSRRRKTTPYEETVDFFGCMVVKGKHKAMKYKAGTLKSITNTFFYHY